MMKQQNKQFHALLAQANLTSQKGNLVLGFTNGRTEKSSEMNEVEAEQAIKYLKAQIPEIKNDGLEVKADRMRKKIISFAWQMNWTYRNTNGAILCDIKRVNAWCEKYSYLKKPLNDYLYSELPKLLTQFENVYKSYLKSF